MQCFGCANVLLKIFLKLLRRNFVHSSGDEQNIRFKSGDLNERYMETLMESSLLAASIKHAAHVLFTLVWRREYIAFKSEDLNEHAIHSQLTIDNSHGHQLHRSDEKDEGEDPLQFFIFKMTGSEV